MTDDEPAGTVPKVIGDNLRRARNARGLSVRQMSERLGEVGAPMLPSAVSENERAARKVTVEDALRFAIALNIPLVDLLTPAGGSVDIAPNVPPIPGHEMAAWVSGADPWPPEADRAEFMQLADEHRRAVDRTWNRPEMLAIAALTGLVREAILGGPKDRVDPAKYADLLRREARRVVKYVDLLADSIGDNDGR